ncbi:MAG: DUF4418 family protein [Treponema sp.]|nr:DUF4418 family protein [Treponema sp.]
MKKINFFDVAILILSVFLCLGSVFLFHACPQKPDGSWMACHHVQNVITLLGACLSFLSVLCIGTPRLLKIILSAVIAAASIFAILIPGTLMRMCMMHEMRCWTVMKPSVTVLCILIAIFSIFNLIKTVLKK